MSIFNVTPTFISNFQMVTKTEMTATCRSGEGFLQASMKLIKNLKHHGGHLN